MNEGLVLRCVTPLGVYADLPRVVRDYGIDQVVVALPEDEYQQWVLEQKTDAVAEAAAVEAILAELDAGPLATLLAALEAKPPAVLARCAAAAAGAA